MGKTNKFQQQWIAHKNATQSLTQILICDVISAVSPDLGMGRKFIWDVAVYAISVCLYIL